MSIDEVIFNKPLSYSFYERSHWNSIAWETIASTWGLGVGFGSTRTSNWFAAIVSNAGLIGAACMAIFLVQTFARRPIWQAPLSTELLAGLKLSLLPPLAMAGVASPGPDFGLWMAVVFGAIAGIAEFCSERGSVGRAAAMRPTPLHAGGRAADGARGIGSGPRALCVVGVQIPGPRSLHRSLILKTSLRCN